MTRSLVVASLLLAAMAFAQPRPPMPPGPPGPPGGGPGGPMMGPPGGGAMGGMGMHAPGIPPQLAQKLGIPAETVTKVRDMALDANEQVIGLEADLKRAQLGLERAMLETTPDEAKVFGKLEGVTRAELAVRRNRVGLMLKIRKLLGPDLWSKLEAEMPMGMGGMHEGPGGGGPGGMMRKEVRVIRGPGGEERTEINE
jgi:Spy/CpxP family protein refolding chaperone